MTIVAKYTGKCTKCADPLKIGDSINWERGSGSSHVACPKKRDQASAAVAPDPNAIKISIGEGYGGRPYSIGQVIRHHKHGLLTVLSASKRYYREDGMSFGVGDESGYIYSATCRPATDAEAAPLIERERVWEEKKAMFARIAEIAKQIQTNGECPQDEQPEGEKLMNTQNIWGGGEWWVIGNGIWYIRNNGSDGDNWASNNVRTGGAGAIGWRIPMDDGLASEIRMLAEKVGAK